MRKLCLILGVLGLFAFSLGVQAEAQVQPVPPPVRGNPMVRGTGGGGYNPATVVTVSGTVTEVIRTVPKKPNQQVRVRLNLQTSQGPINVQLGPAAYVDQQPVKIVAGDSVEVTGSQISKGRISGIMAAQVKKGDQILQLRNEQGQPLWRGMKRPGM
jgi:ribosomal protein S12